MGSAIFGGLLGGIGEGLHERWEKQRQMREGASKAALSYLTALSQRDDFDPTMIPELNRTYFQVLREVAQPGSVLPSGKGGKGKQTGPIDLAEQLMGGMGQQISSMPSAKGRPARTAEIAGVSGAEAERPSPWTVPPVPQAKGTLPEAPAPTGAPGKMMARPVIPSLDEFMGRQQVTMPEGPSGPTTRRGYIIPPAEMAQLKREQFQTQETIKHKNAMELAQVRAQARGAHAVGSPQLLKGDDGKLHRFQTFMETDGTVTQLDLGEAGSTQSNLTKTWVQRPGSTEPELAFVNPKDPKGYISADGEELPGGTKAVATPTQERLYGAVQGYYYAAKARGLSDADAKKEAGLMFEKFQGATLGGIQQRQTVEAALSGIGAGPGFGPTTKAPPVPLPGAPAGASETTKPAPVDRTVVPPVPGTTAAARPPTPVKGTSPIGMNQKESDDVLLYLSHNITGTLGTNRSAAVREQAGLKALAKMTGLNPLELSASLAENKAGVKQLAETVQRAGAIQRLNNTIDTHGKVLEDVAKNIKDTGSPLFNQPVREWSRKMAGSPELKRFQIAQNALQREYAYLTAGGAQSRAMLPVNTTTMMEHMLSPDSTMAEVLAAVDQIRVEAAKESEAMQKTKDDLKTQLTGGPVGAAFGGRRDQVPPVPGIVEVKAPNGKTYKFSDQKAADDFKKAAGIK